MPRIESTVWKKQVLARSGGSDSQDRVGQTAFFGYRLKKTILDIKKHKNYYLFALPAIAVLLVFRYGPAYYMQIAFMDYRVTRGIAGSPWVGFSHFIDLFSSWAFLSALRNTFILSFFKLLIGFPIPILLSLLLNEIRSTSFKRVTQTLIYLPHFISWAIIGGIMYDIFSVQYGIVNSIISSLGFEPIFFLGSRDHFRAVLVLSDIWKTAGWGTILYLSAIAAVDPGLYEAAYIDGANRFQRAAHVTLPAIKSTIVVLLIINLGRILEVGFEQILVLSNPMVMPVADVLDTYIYRIGLQQGRHSLAAAAGFFKTVVAALMVFVSDRIMKTIGERGIF